MHCYRLSTVDPHLVNTPPLWTVHPYGHLLHMYMLGCGVTAALWPMATPSFTSVDTSLLWTLFVWPLAVHISEVLLYKQAKVALDSYQVKEQILPLMDKSHICPDE